MPLVVIAGGPGAGKTTLLKELSALGHQTVSDSAREVIRERKAAGLSPRPNELEFANEILRRDTQKYQIATPARGLVFFERCALESRAMVEAAMPPDGDSKRHKLENFKFYGCVFVLPPWQEIYENDAERDHTFEHAEKVHSEVLKFYPALGYKLCEVPRGTPAQRAEFVLRSVAASAA